MAETRILELVRNYASLLISRGFKIVNIFLFGSYVNGTSRSESDIDVALVLEELDDMDNFDAQVKMFVIASDIDTRIEPHPFTVEDFNENSPFVAEIKRTGERIEF
jgi:predicted nucleotidyltransferase